MKLMKKLVIILGMSPLTSQGLAGGYPDLPRFHELVTPSQYAKYTCLKEATSAAIAKAAEHAIQISKDFTDEISIKLGNMYYIGEDGMILNTSLYEIEVHINNKTVVRVLAKGIMESTIFGNTCEGKASIIDDESFLEE